VIESAQSDSSDHHNREAQLSYQIRLHLVWINGETPAPNAFDENNFGG